MTTCRAAAAARARLPSKREAERGLAMRILLHSPKDMVAGVLAFAAVSAIIANALFLQAGHHPSPMFGSVVAMPPAASAPASPLPRPRPVEPRRPVEASPPESRPAELKAVEIKAAEPKAVEPKVAEPKADPLANLVKATARSAGAIQCPRPPASIPASRNEHRQRRAPCGGGAAGADRIWLWPVEADRNRRLRHPGRDPEIRARAQDAGDRPDVGSPGARTRRHDGPADRVVHFPARFARGPNARSLSPGARLQFSWLER